ncbi:lipid II flippase MurJ [Pandoraea sputorum]|uniref:lipid II flippase MurJ n=1 Tax=Pandoraea sputorum TaxID=93222 RepID=UPI00123F71C2|nr:lipid II flippase MurJ [Pandoraea sputorum]VVE84398.1 hypothetical protein PSP31120_04632 [Pandoraea sputorum]
MLRSSIVVTFITLLGSALGFIVQLILAHRFGAGTDVDTYLFAISWPTFVAGMVSAFLSYVAIPELVSRERNADIQRDYFMTSLAVIGGFSVLILIAGIGLGSLQLASLPAGSVIREHPARNSLVRLGWLICASQIVQAYLLSTLHARRRHISSATLGLLPYVGMICLTATLSSQIGVTSIALGMLLGSVAAALLAGACLRGQFTGNAPRRWLWRDVGTLFATAPYAAVALSCFSIYAVVDAYWAPRAGEGVLASLGYAQRLVIAIGNLAVAGPSAILVPRITDLARHGDPAALRGFLRKTVLIVAAAATVFALPLAVLPDLLVRLMFARGNFSAHDVANVASTLAHMTPGMVCMLISVISLRALFCLPGAEKVAAVLGAAWGVLYFAASALWMHDGATGLANAYSVTWMMICAAMVTILFKKAGGDAHGRATASV